MKKIVVAAVTFAMFACGDSTNTSDHGHNHDTENHEGHDHESHKGHDHDSHKGHDHDNHKEDKHDSHEGHDHASHKENEHDSHKGHDHDSHEGHNHGEHADIGDGKHFGAETTKENSITVDEAIALLSKKNIKNAEINDVKIYGKIHEVCQSKGCWLKLNGSEDQQIWVKFKDYAFFAPKDAAGQMGTFHGSISLEQQSVADLQHFADDAGKSKEEIAKITAPEDVYSLMVDGFVLD